MFIWDFVADKILGQIVDWFYGQVVGFLGNFFAEMGNMGVELFEMSWVQSIVLFFSYLAWALYGTGLVVACFECGIEYSSGQHPRNRAQCHQGLYGREPVYCRSGPAL